MNAYSLLTQKLSEQLRSLADQRPDGDELTAEGAAGWIALAEVIERITDCNHPDAQAALCEAIDILSTEV